MYPLTWQYFVSKWWMSRSRQTTIMTACSFLRTIYNVGYYLSTRGSGWLRTSCIIEYTVSVDEKHMKTTCLKSWHMNLRVPQGASETDKLWAWGALFDKPWLHWISVVAQVGHFHCIGLTCTNRSLSTYGLQSCAKDTSSATCRKKSWRTSNLDDYTMATRSLIGAVEVKMQLQHDTV